MFSRGTQEEISSFVIKGKVIVNSKGLEMPKYFIFQRISLPALNLIRRFSPSQVFHFSEVLTYFLIENSLKTSYL